VAIVPAAIRGTEVAFGRHARVPRLFAPIAVRFGEAIDSAQPDALERARAAVQGMLAEGGAAPAGPR
jgi:1-acyl-sn-glycerol-3-phosphate acyltransferase